MLCVGVGAYDVLDGCRVKFHWRCRWVAAIVGSP